MIFFGNNITKPLHQIKPSTIDEPHDQCPLQLHGINSKHLIFNVCPMSVTLCDQIINFT
jgi:hypothetical protein